MNTSVHFSSASENWATPQDFFDQMNALHGPFDLDVCASPENAKCPRYYTREDDGLAQPWTGKCWLNPPYGRTIGQWMKKAYEESLCGAIVVCLVPARTDTAWWHNYAMKGEVTFLRGRLKFGGHRNSAPFPSAVVKFGEQLPENREAGLIPILMKDLHTPVEPKQLHPLLLDDSYEGEIVAFDCRERLLTIQLDEMPTGKPGHRLGARAMLVFVPNKKAQRACRPEDV